MSTNPNHRNNSYRQKPNADLSEYVFGKLQPQAIPLEEAVLGALMIDREAIIIVSDFLRPEHFYLEQHREIYAACLHLYESSNPIDLLTVAEELKRREKLLPVGGSYYLTELASRVASSANIEYHARIIHQKWVAREVIQAGTNAVRDGYDDSTDPFDLLEKTEAQLFQIASGTAAGAMKSAEQLAFSVVKDAVNARHSGGNLTGIPSGFSSIDKLTAGWQASNLIIIAARPGMGKTSLVMNTAVETAKLGNPVLVFSLEMSAAQLMQRIISGEANVDGMRLRDGRFTDSDQARIEKVADAVGKLPLYIDDTPAISATDLRARARRHKMKHGLSLIVVDYIQLMSGSADDKRRNGNREQEVSSISRMLKGIAKELNVPVIALSQLSRAVETRGGSKRPGLSDLRESGAIEQDADMVAFIYRPEYYKIMEDETGLSTAGLAELIIEKNRFGALGTVRLHFDKETTKFSDPQPVNTITAPAYVNDFTIPNSQRREPDDDMPF